ncbi:MAG: Fic family protein [Deltaproteobacteria bacterium]|nr:Fic family protein [Deltaproteobacteria bacterium]
MDKIYPKLKEEYQFWMRQIGEDHFAGAKTIGFNDVLRAHYLLVDYFIREGEAIAASGPKSTHLLMSAIGRQTAGYGGTLKWSDDLEVCATLFFGLVKNHPFVDGNKRTGFLIAIYQLLKMGRTPDAPQKEFEKLAPESVRIQS